MKKILLENLVSDLVSRKRTASELATEALATAQQTKQLNAFVALDDDLVLRQARQSTERWRNGTPLSQLDGVPLVVKDNYLTKDYPTTACSRALPLEEAGIDSALVANLRQAGAIIFGKTNMHEWAYGATNTISTAGRTKNPHNPQHISGGSSGGTAVAVAAGVVAAGLGSDTGGSVRIPAAACGVYGFKPTYGRASSYGLLPLSYSLDAPGIIASSLAGIELLAPFILKSDATDEALTKPEAMSCTEVFRAKVPRIKVPRPESVHLLNLVGRRLERSAEVEQGLNQALQKSGMLVEQYELKHLPEYFSVWEAIMHCEASSYHEELLHSSAQGFSEITRAHLEAGRRISGVELLKAQRLRGRFLKTLLTELPAWDALVLPTLPVTAPRQDATEQEFSGQRVSTQDSMTWFCWIANLAGLPAISIPIGKDSLGLPIGLMLMGKPSADEELLAIAQLLVSSQAIHAP